MPNSCSKQAFLQIFDWKSILFKKAVNIFEHMEIAESIYEDLVETSYKNLPGYMPTVLVAAGIREDNPPCLRFTPRPVRVLESAEKVMYIYGQGNLKPVSFTALDIILMNVSCWETLVLSTLKVSLLRTTEIILYQGKYLTGSREKCHYQ